jgi:hypothetical protein
MAAFSMNYFVQNARMLRQTHLPAIPLEGIALVLIESFA